MTAKMPERAKRPLIRTLRSASALVWSAAPRELALMTGTQIISAIGVMLQLLLARELLIDVTETEPGAIEFSDVLPVLIALGAVRIVVSLVAELRSEIRLVAYDRITAAAAADLYEVATSVELGSFDDADFHDRLQRAYRNVDRRIWSAVWSLVSLVSSVATLSVLVIVVITLAPLVLVFAVIAAAPLWWVRRKNNEASYAFAYEQTPEDRERNYIENILVSRDAAAEIRALELGPTLIERVKALYQRRIEKTQQLIKNRFPWSAGATVTSNLIAVGSIGLLVALIIDESVSVADGGVAILALQQAASRLTSMSEAIGSLSGAAMFLDDYETFIRGELEASDHDAAQSAATAPSPSSEMSLESVEMRNVTFTYPGMPAPVLKDVSLSVGKGELVALVGVNGSGKTTISKLLGGLYPADDGTITWTTSDGAVRDREAIRPLVGNVFQHFLRLDMSAGENVTFGDVRREWAAPSVWEALDSAGLDDVIRAHPAQLDGRLGRSFQDGQDLSAGQWQRMSIARAFYRDAPLLILDEPTAAVDAEAEADVFEVIRQLQRDRAVLLITHRMATVKEADRIYVMEHGRVIEQGRHDDLLDLGGVYAHLYKIQASSYVDPT